MNIFQKMLENTVEDGKSEEKCEEKMVVNKEVIKAEENKEEAVKIDFWEKVDPATGILERHLDPRPDHKEDHLRWVDMLQNCLVWDGFSAPGQGERVWGILHGLRCGGARIQRIDGGLGYRLLPGEWKAEDWQQVKRDYLDGIKDEIVKLFKLTREFGRLPRIEEVFPEEGQGEEAEREAEGETEQIKLF